MHINVDDSLKRKGVAFKLYQQFIKLFGTACSLFKNRVATFYDENNVLTSSDAAIDGLWKKLEQMLEFNVLPIRNKNKEVIGVKAILK